MPKVLLHICCAACACGALERLKEEGFLVEGFFYNPNIHPPSEYRDRKNDLEKVSRYFKVKIREGEYDAKRWFLAVKGYEKEREGGKRCEICFRLRLERVYNEFLRGDFDFFTTTLTIGPQKNAALINSLGEEIGKGKFLARDFKKKDGFKTAVAISPQMGIYRQNYCGCIFSKLEREEKRKAKK